MTIEDARRAFLGLPDTAEGAHHGHPDFRRSGRIFGTLWPEQDRAVLQLSAEHAAVISSTEPAKYRIIGNPKEFGWVNVTLPNVDESEFTDLVELAWRLVPPKPKRGRTSAAS